MKLSIPADRFLISAALMVCTFLTALDVMIVGTVMPTIIGSLGGLELYSWVFSVYLLAATVSMPIYGKLADLYGRKPLFFAGTGLFLLGSALCGLAQSMEQLIAFRALQGLGSGAVFPITMTIVGDIFTLEQRARVTGLFSSVWGIASIIGPPLGGVVTTQASWRWVFLINLPIGLAAMAMLARALQERVERRAHSIDYPGALLLSIGISVLLLGLVQGGFGSQRGPGPPAVLALVIAAALLAAFVWQERRAPEPLLPLDLFQNRLIAAASLGAFMSGAALFGTNAFVPPFVQGVLGETVIATAFPLITWSLSWTLGSFLAGRVVIRTGYRATGVLGAAILAVGTYGLTRLNIDSLLWHVAAVTSLIGLGLGFCTLAFLVSVQNAVNWNQRGVVTSSNMFFRSIGGTIGATLAGAVFNARLSAELAALEPGLNFDANALLEPSARAQIGPSLLPAVELALQRSLQDAYSVTFWLAVVAVCAALMLPGGGAAQHAWRERPEAGAARPEMN